MPVPLYKLCPSADGLTPDADLLARFSASRDEAAFVELVRRHGPVVYRVCRRLVPGHADDAFQAVFLIFACRAAAVRNPAVVGAGSSALLGASPDSYGRRSGVARITNGEPLATRRRNGRPRNASSPRRSTTSSPGSRTASATR